MSIEDPPDDENLDSDPNKISNDVNTESLHCFCSGVTIQGGTDTPLGCIRIKRVIINSPAAAAGIIPNDILLSVDGRTSYFRLDLF